ncbi:hypothetical protein H4W31_006975 [Plantactinospora soyae]|uniref:Uncharacterized protein n=1 Tax=Plantactinospora soyae TaxID=1544732 RepID=A0A927MCQ5_9ACTN|nr:hypothetical protein [Plantactinospora soyae]
MMAVVSDDLSERAADRTPTGISVAIGSVLVVVAAVVAAALFPRGEVAGRLVVMAVVVGGYATFVPDLRAVLSVYLLSVLVFTGFLANQYGELTTRHGDLWWYALTIGFAAVLGIGYRRIRRSALDDPSDPVGEVVVPADLSPVAGRAGERSGAEGSAQPAWHG